ncbi:hypothetical protein C0214_20275 [Methylobacterium sp. DM1]|nr:hypothetical protein C0214_20275 [Methylobacterium sp. DM1]
MLTNILRGLGILPQSKPQRPASRRHETPTPPRPTAHPTPARASDREVKAAAARADAQRRSDARWAEAIRLILRAGDASDTRYIDPRELLLARGCVGPEVGEYLRACQYAGIAVRRIGDAELADAQRLAAYRADLTLRAATDAEGWDKGHLALIERQKGARRTGREPEPDLVIPPDVQGLIAKMLADRLARLSRRQGGGQGTQGAVPPPPPPPPAAPPAAPQMEEPPEDEPEEPGSTPAPMGRR